MRGYWAALRASITRAWLVGYAAYLTIIVGGWLLDRYLVEPKSRTGFYIGWAVIIVTALVLQSYVQKHAKRRD